MQKRKKIPASPDFATAAHKACELLAELGISSFPIDPFAILEELPEECCICSWQELRQQGCDDPFSLRRHGAEAKTLRMRHEGSYMLIYDASRKKDRIRWTIAHEIGHIVLGHLTKYEATALSRSGLTPAEYQVLEVEAHWFASNLLAPHAVLREYRATDHWDIARICQISEEAARKCQAYVKKPCNLITQKEHQMIRNFHSYFCNHGYGSLRIPNLLHYQGGRYEDYVEFEHWNYVKFSILKSKKDIPLYQAVYPSRAIIDGPRLVIFTENLAQKTQIEAQARTLQDIARRFALTKITEVQCLCLP